MGAGRRTDPCSSNQVGTGHCSRLAGKGGCMSAWPSSATWENTVVASGGDGRRGAQGQRTGRDPQAHAETWAACTPAHEPRQGIREREVTRMPGDRGRGVEQSWCRSCGPEEATWQQSPPRPAPPHPSPTARPAHGFSDTSLYSNKPTFCSSATLRAYHLLVSEISLPLSTDALPGGADVPLN